jgi:hypothetical protein
MKSTIVKFTTKEHKDTFAAAKEAQNLKLVMKYLYLKQKTMCFLFTNVGQT